MRLAFVVHGIENVLELSPAALPPRVPERPLPQAHDFVDAELTPKRVMALKRCHIEFVKATSINFSRPRDMPLHDDNRVLDQSPRSPGLGTPHTARLRKTMS